MLKCTRNYKTIASYKNKFILVFKYSCWEKSGELCVERNMNLVTLLGRTQEGEIIETTMEGLKR